MSLARPFSPLGAAVSIAGVTNATSASTALPGAGGMAAKVTNLQNVPATVAFATASGGAVASATTEVIPAGAERIVSIPFNTVDVAVYTIGTANGNVIVQRGEGGV